MADPDETIILLLFNVVEELVPPLAIGKMPVTSDVKLMAEEIMFLDTSNFSGKLAVSADKLVVPVNVLLPPILCVPAVITKSAAPNTSGIV